MRFYLIIIITFTVSNLSAQEVTLSGHILDIETGESLIGATIYDTASKRGTTSNEYGFYSLTIPQTNDGILLISYLGYTSLREKIFPTEDQINNFSLLSENFLLEEVELVGTKELSIENVLGEDFLRRISRRFSRTFF